MTLSKVHFKGASLWFMNLYESWTTTIFSFPQFKGNFTLPKYCDLAPLNFRHVNRNGFARLTVVSFGVQGCWVGNCGLRRLSVNRGC